MQSSGWTQQVDPVERIIAERVIDANGNPYVVVVDFPPPSVLSRPFFELLSADFSGRPTRASRCGVGRRRGRAFCFMLAGISPRRSTGFDQPPRKSRASSSRRASIARCSIAATSWPTSDATSTAWRPHRDLVTAQRQLLSDVRTRFARRWRG